MPSLKEGYEIRQARKSDAKEIAFVHLTTWKTAYAEIIEKSYLESLSLQDRIDLRNKILNTNEGVHLVATFHEKVVAFYDADTFRFHKNQKVSANQLKDRAEPGEVYAIYILQEHQHVGIGSALFQLGRIKLKERKLTPFIAWVLKENHQAIKFYEKMGGKLVDEISVTIGDKQYIEIAYQFS